MLPLARVTTKDPFIVRLIRHRRRLVYVSVATARIVASLPPSLVDEDENRDD